MKRLIRFVLVPDAGAARRLRRTIVAGSPRSGVIVGTWPELLELARSAYLVPPLTRDWDRLFHRALGDAAEAFWSASFQVAPMETAAEVEAALSLLVGATEPGEEVVFPEFAALPVRPRRHVADLARLLDSLDGILPDELSLIRQLMTANTRSAIRLISVSHIDHYPPLTRWQAAVIKKLNQEAGVDTDPDLDEMLKLQLGDCISSAPGNSLQAIQRQLFTTPADKVGVDTSTQWLGVRDYLEEVEVAAVMVQQMLAENSELPISEIGLLLPDTIEYAHAVDDVFASAGLPVSGLPADRWQRDLGGEALLLFLSCIQKPAPAMAMASCLSSPLMPWSKEQGAALASKAMGEGWGLKAWDAATRTDKAMLGLLGKSCDSPVTLMPAIRRFVRLLSKDPSLQMHVNRAKGVAEELCLALAEAETIEWVALKRMATSGHMTSAAPVSFSQQGLTVWRESQECWRPVRFLIVLGFASGHYPLAGRDSSVFASGDLVVIRDRMSLPVATPDDLMAERRARFRRQLSNVAEFVCFMIPRRDAAGKPEIPSDSLVFMSQLYRGDADADALILEMDSPSDRAQACFVPLDAHVTVRPPRVIAAEDLQLECDLLSIPKPSQVDLPQQSPSSLETLMVSPLAWLIKRIEAEPDDWEPERLDVKLMGILTHEVFEHFFQPRQAVPTREDLHSQVQDALANAIRKKAAFLGTPQWEVERQHLEAGIIKAALAWAEVLKGLNAEIIAAEVGLQGYLEDKTPIHGKADLLLTLPDGRLLVVDYKRQGVGRRKPAMQKGYDSQASLYRIMLQTGGLEDGSDEALAQQLRSADGIGIVYFMTTDEVALSNVRPTESGAIPGWDFLSGDVSKNAMDLIRVRIQELRNGSVVLNRKSDLDSLEKTTGLKSYAPQTSALISLFAIQDATGEVG